jgi:hypothetical protein
MFGADKSQYICVSQVGLPENFDINKWQKIGVQYDMMHVALPHDEFDYNADYSVGDIVFWNGKVYQCLIETQQYSHAAKINIGFRESIPSGNVSPTDKQRGLLHWGVGVAYSVSGVPFFRPIGYYSDWTVSQPYTAGTYIMHNGDLYKCISNSTGYSPDISPSKWQRESVIKKDSRSSQMVQYVCDIALYHIHSRIAPQNVPQLRLDRYNAAKQWLVDIAAGVITAALPLNKPLSTSRIMYGGATKLNNTY